VLDQLAVPGHSLKADDLVAAVLREEPEAAPEACREFVAVALEACSPRASSEPSRAPAP
jgi:hypothetical protein